MEEPVFATAADLEARWRPLTQAETATADVLLADASQLVLDECPDAASKPPRTLERVVCAIVKRAMSAPGGEALVSLQQGAGPFQQTRQFANPTGDLYLTKAERRALGCGRQRAFEIDLLPPEGP